MTTGGGLGSLQSYRTYGCSTSRPPWLQTTLADLSEKMKTLAINLPEEDDSDSFAERAENYYRKRPQLLSLLQDLYNGYVTLADRYSQTLIKHNPSPIYTVQSDIDDDEYQDPNQIDSDAESTLSYQTPTPPPPQPPRSQIAPESDTLIAQLVIKTVDYEILLHELDILERCHTESSRKMELQKSLLEVLESERLILLNENARLGYRVATLAEENKGLVSESVFMKRKASELARCVLKMREDHRVCLLSRKIEDLQGQIYGLEERNREYYEQLVRKEEEEKKKKKKEAALEVCFEVDKLKMENQRLKEEAMTRAGVSVSGWWDRVKKFDLFYLCGSNPNPRSGCCQI